MSTKKRRNTNSQHRDSNVGAGMTAKQRRRKRPINNAMLVDVEPITDNQKILFEEYAKDPFFQLHKLYMHILCS